MPVKMQSSLSIINTMKENKKNPLLEDGPIHQLDYNKPLPSATLIGVNWSDRYQTHLEYLQYTTIASQVVPMYTSIGSESYYNPLVHNINTWEYRYNLFTNAIWPSRIDLNTKFTMSGHYYTPKSFSNIINKTKEYSNILNYNDFIVLYQDFTKPKCKVLFGGHPDYTFENPYEPNSPGRNFNLNPENIIKSPMLTYTPLRYKPIFMESKERTTEKLKELKEKYDNSINLSQRFIQEVKNKSEENAYIEDKNHTN